MELEQKVEADRLAQMVKQKEGDYSFMPDQKLMNNNLLKFKRRGEEAAVLFQQSAHSIQKVRKLIKKCRWYGFLPDFAFLFLAPIVST